MTPYKNWTNGEFRLVDESNPSDVAQAEADGFVVFVPPPGSVLPMPYQAGLRLYDFQIGNKNRPKA